MADGLLHSGTGYIGSFTTLALLEHGYHVVIVDSLYNSSEVALDRIELLCGKRPDFYKVDITDEEALDKVFAAHPNIDSVIHFAALKVVLAQEIRRKDTDLCIPGSRRIIRDPSRILPCQCWWNHYPPPMHDQAQCLKYRLLLLRDRLR